MKILFFDIETVPTEQSLQDNGLLESQIRLDEAEIIKKLSLAAATASILCLAYALEPPLDSPVSSIHGDETRHYPEFLETRDRNPPLRRSQYSGFRSSIYLSTLYHSSNQAVAGNSVCPLSQRSRFSTRCTNGANGDENTSVWTFSPELWRFHHRKKVSTGRKSIPITAPGGFLRSASTATATWKPYDRFTADCRFTGTADNICSSGIHSSSIEARAVRSHLTP